MRGYRGTANHLLKKRVKKQTRSAMARSMPQRLVEKILARHGRQ